MTNRLPSLAQRLTALRWEEIETSLDELGYAKTPPVLTASECDDVIRLYADDTLFRSRIDMARFRFGVGEYKYFADPLPELVSTLRAHFYPHLAIIANRWLERLAQRDRFPATIREYLVRCNRYGQKKPTPLILRYETGGYNCLHQDLYGELAFPLQVAAVLSQSGKDYAGGEFLLCEQRPRAQTRGEAISIEQGAFVIFPNRHRPVRGTRGDYRVNVRHGVSRLKSGTRYCLGIIFHDAK